MRRAARSLNMVLIRAQFDFDQYRHTHFVYEELTEACASDAAEVPGFIPRLGQIFGKEATGGYCHG
jgi:hypothetical protein